MKLPDLQFEICQLVSVVAIGVVAYVVRQFAEDLLHVDWSSSSLFAVQF